MNNHIEKKAQNLHAWLLSEQVVQEYQKYEQELALHSELKNIEETLKELQQEIVKNKHKQIDSQNLIDDYQKLKASFDENPIVVNYLFYKEEVNKLLIEIQDDICQQLQKMG